jgi:hypothetical protein
MAGPMPRDPAADTQRFAARYPRLAERMSRAQRDVLGPGDATTSPHLRARLEQIVEACGALLHQAIDLAQRIACTSIRAAGRRPRA